MREAGFRSALTHADSQTAPPEDPRSSLWMSVITTQIMHVMVFCNCDSESTYYAGRSDDYKENLKNVTLYPCLDLYPGGGCHVNCMTAPGQATIARLNRYKDRYRMTIIPAEFVTLPREKMKETTEEWPHVFAKLPFDHEIFIQKFDANHCHAVYGDHVEELKTICKMLDIDVEVLGE